MVLLKQNIVFANTSSSEQAKVFIIVLINLAPFSNDLAILFQYSFGIDFANFHGPKMGPWDKAPPKNIDGEQTLRMSMGK